MAEKTGIQFADGTFNLVDMCTAVGPGCGERGGDTPGMCYAKKKNNQRGRTTSASGKSGT